MDTSESHARVAPDVVSVSELAGSGSDPAYGLNPSILPALDDAPGNGLALYDSAKRALAEAHRVDEVKDIRDKAVAMAAYAIQAKDSALIDNATDIRLRAERRAGELLAEMDKNKGAAGGGMKDAPRGSFKLPRDMTPTLADLGVSKTQSSRWQKLAALSEHKFETRVGHAKREAVRSVELTRAERAAEKKERRAEREAELGRRQTALPGNLYGVLYSDCPWRFEPYSRDTGMDRAADNHYPTMTFAKLLELKVPAASDSILFHWATVPMLVEAIDVMQAWGFEYKSHCVWIKDRIGTGYWFRNKHELLLVGTRGKVPAPIMGTQWESVIHAPVGEHSAKPAIFREMIEGFFPSLPKLEMFARGKAPDGWEFYGNEAEP